MQTTRSTPSRHTPIRGGKRKRTLLEESEERSSSDYSVSGSARGDVEITEADPQGRYVKLTNKGSKVRYFNYFKYNSSSRAFDNFRKY